MLFPAIPEPLIVGARLELRRGQCSLLRIEGQDLVPAFAFTPTWTSVLFDSDSINCSALQQSVGRPLSAACRVTRHVSSAAATLIHSIFGAVTLARENVTIIGACALCLLSATPTA